MKKTILPLIVLFAASCSTRPGVERKIASVEVSEVEQVKSRLETLGYSIPSSTVDRYHEIYRELTPESTAVKGTVLKKKFSTRCVEREVKIEYKEKGELQSFEVILKQPNPVYSGFWFRGKKKFPLIVVQPTLAGPSILEERIAYDLCRFGFASIVPKETLIGVPEKLPDYKSYDRNLRTEMIRARKMIDYGFIRDDIDTRNIGVIGFSRGGIAGSLLIGLDQRIKFAYLGAGGVGLGEVIARSKTEQGLSDNAKQMKAANIDSDEFEKLLVENVEYDPILFSHRFKKENLRIMIVPNDESVSTHHQELLRKAFNFPETRYVDKGHVGSILSLVYIYKKDYLDFFLSQVKE
jgi:hypothetical protein